MKFQRTQTELNTNLTVILCTGFWSVPFVLNCQNHFNFILPNFAEYTFSSETRRQYNFNIHSVHLLCLWSWCLESSVVCVQLQHLVTLVQRMCWAQIDVACGKWQGPTTGPGFSSSCFTPNRSESGGFFSAYGKNYSCSMNYSLKWGCGWLQQGEFSGKMTFLWLSVGVRGTGLPQWHLKQERSHAVASHGKKILTQKIAKKDILILINLGGRGGFFGFGFMWGFVC